MTANEQPIDIYVLADLPVTTLTELEGLSEQQLRVVWTDLVSIEDGFRDLSTAFGDALETPWHPDHEEAAHLAAITEVTAEMIIDRAKRTATSHPSL